MFRHSMISMGLIQLCQVNKEFPLEICYKQWDILAVINIIKLLKLHGKNCCSVTHFWHISKFCFHHKNYSHYGRHPVLKYEIDMVQPTLFGLIENESQCKTKRGFLSFTCVSYSGGLQVLLYYTCANCIHVLIILYDSVYFFNLCIENEVLCVRAGYMQVETSVNTILNRFIQ